MKTKQLLLLLFFSLPVVVFSQIDKASEIKTSHTNLNLPQFEVEENDDFEKRTLKPWLKSPYLNVAPDKATVGELTFAFKQWRKDNPDKFNSNKRHKDDDIVKYQRRLHTWQMENSFDEVPMSNNDKMDAFRAIEAQKSVQPERLMNNPDANWSLLGPVNDPLETSYYEVNDPKLVSQDNTGLGRVNCLEFSRWDTLNIWAGTSTGGVWKTWNGGKSWINISMNLPIMEICDIAIDQNNSNIIYLATGDRDLVPFGGGHYGLSQASRLYKTTDGGNTWIPITANFGTGAYIMNLWVNPNRTNEVIVVKTSGIYKSTNGGSTWSQVLKTNFVPPFTPTNDLIFMGAAYADLSNPERIYASYLQRQADGSFSFQVHRSDNFGTNWLAPSTVTATLNDSTFLLDYVRLAVAPSDANTLYILATEFDEDSKTDRFGAIVCTTNGGSTWETRSRYPSVKNLMGWLMGDEGEDDGSQAPYDMVLTVDPKNKDKVFVGGVDMWGSMDGGRSFNKSTFWTNSAGASVHADHHWGEYQPISGNYFLATDGGIFKTGDLQMGNNELLEDCRHGINDLNKAITTVFTPGCYQFPTKWEYVGNGISNNEFYAIAVSKSNPSIIMGGAQDNGTLIRRNGIWYSVFGGDGFVPLIHPTDPNTYYASVYFGWLSRTDDGGRTYRDVSKGMDSLDVGGWLTPTEMYEPNPNIIFQCRDNYVWRTTNGGNTWQPISNFPAPDYHFVNTAMGISQSNANILCVARITIDSQRGPINRFLYKTTDGGETWKNIWSTAFPGQVLYAIKIHPTNPNKIWVSFTSGFSTANPNQAKKVFYTTDGGTTWTNISAGLPAVPAWTIAVPENSPVDAVYVGTAIGVFYKDNSMTRFMEWQTGMPRGVRVTDLKIHDASGKIFAGTHGRGIWSANLYDRPYEGFVASAKPNRNLLLNVYPNPANHVIRVVWDDANREGQTLNVTDMYGRILFSKTDFQGRTTVDISQFSTGVYTVQLTSGKEVLVKKFTVSK